MKIKILIVVLVIMTSCKKEVKNDKIIPEKQTEFIITNGNNCFKEIIENKVEKDGKTVVETNVLIVNIKVDGNKVTGIFDYLPFNDKVNKGVFNGTISNNIVKSICVFNNSKKKEEVIFKIDPNKVSILGGEKEEVNGVWVFKDASKGFYMNEIPRINCN